MIRPESAPVYDQIDLKLGIKSSLPSVKPTLALLFLMWREMGRPSELEYATAQGNAIVLRTDIEEALYQRLQEVSDGVTLEQFRDKVNNNLMLKAQLEALLVAFELVWKVAKIRFSDGRPNSAERTGGSRFPKKVWFTLNKIATGSFCYDSGCTASHERIENPIVYVGQNFNKMTHEHLWLLRRVFTIFALTGRGYCGFNKIVQYCTIVVKCTGACFVCEINPCFR